MPASEATTNRVYEAQSRVPGGSISLAELADTLVRSTLDLALQATRSLAERTNALARLAAESAELVRVAPELSAATSASVVALGDHTRSIATVLTGIHALTDEATTLMEFVAGESDAFDHVLTIDELATKLEKIALRSVEAGEDLKRALVMLDEGIERAWRVVEPMLNLIYQVNAISSNDAR